MWSLFPPLATVWTWTSIDFCQMVSYYSMLYIWSAFICLAPYECTCGSSFLHVNVFIHLCSECKLLFNASYHHDLKCGFSFFRLPLWTCALTYAQPVSYFSLFHILCMIMILTVVSLSSTFSVWTWIFPYSQEVSYFSLLHILCMIMILNVVSLSPLATVWTCAFTYPKDVSYFSLLHILCMIVT